MKKVLGIIGSARKDGNTFLLMKEMFDELEKDGVKTEIIELASKNIQPCKACFACGRSENCVHRNDHFYGIFEAMKKADGIVLGSPVYSANVSSSMQALIERSAVVIDMHPGLFKHKVGASLAVCRRLGGMEALDTMNHFFLNHEMYLVGSSYWNVGYGQMKGDVLKDSEAINTIHNLAKNMSYLLSCLPDTNAS